MSEGPFWYVASPHITKTRLFKYIENFTTTNWKFQIKIRYFFSIFLLRNKAVLTNTYNLCFWAEIRKIMYTPVNSSFTCILCKSVKKGGRTYILLGMFSWRNYLIWLRLWRFANQMRQPRIIICCICKSMIHEARILHSREEWKLSRDTDSRRPINNKIQDKKTSGILTI